MVLVITFFITRVLWCVKRWQQHVLTLLKKSHQIWGFVFLMIKSRWLVESLMNAFRPINYSADKISWFWQKSPVCYPQAFWEHILRELFIAVGWPIQLGYPYCIWEYLSECHANIIKWKNKGKRGIETIYMVFNFIKTRTGKIGFSDTTTFRASVVFFAIFMMIQLGGHLLPFW